MLCFKFRGRHFIISSEVCGLVLGIILFQGFQYLLQKRKNHENDSEEEGRKMRRIVNVARGGDLHIAKAVESCVDGPGYYELVDLSFVQELKKLLGCKSTKPIIMVTVGVVNVVKKYVFSNKSTLVQWLPIPQFYRWEKVILQGAAWFLIFITVNAIAPLFMRNFQAVAFAITLAINPGYTFKSITNLPTILPTLQYVEHLLPQSQRVIMKVSDGGKLFEKTGEKVIEN